MSRDRGLHAHVATPQARDGVDSDVKGPEGRGIGHRAPLRVLKGGSWAAERTTQPRGNPEATEHRHQLHGNPEVMHGNPESPTARKP